MKIIKKILKILAFAESTACVAVTVVMAFACILQVLNRNILQLPLKWTEELARFSMVWLGLIGASIGLRQGKHLSVNLLYDKISGPLKRIFRIAGNLLNAAFCGATAYYGVFTVSHQWNQFSPGMHLSTGIVYLIIPVSLGVMAVYSLFQFFLDILGKTDTASPTAIDPGKEV